MNQRLRLLLTRPSDESFESYVSFRQNSFFKPKTSKTVLIKDELVNEWKKFWEMMNSSPKRKGRIDNYLN
mgnify:CR=1 FL=1